MKKVIIILIVLGLITAGYFLLKLRSSETKEEKPIVPSQTAPLAEPSAEPQAQPPEPVPLPKELTLTSSAFEHFGKIPSKYTCDGQKINPPLGISGVDENAKSLVLIMEDPDVPKSIRSDGMWNHWLKFNLPASLTEIKEGTDPGGVSGLGTSNTLKYVGPCPPDREHRYFFKLYSLDAILDLKEGATKAQIESAMKNHILQQIVLIGLYER